jgi:hypothetical protein
VSNISGTKTSSAGMAYYPGNGSNSPKLSSTQNHMRIPSNITGGTQSPSGVTQNKFGYK